MGNYSGRHYHAGEGVGGGAVFSRLTPVALRAPCVSREKGKSGTSYFAQKRNFLFCLDTVAEGAYNTASGLDALASNTTGYSNEASGSSALMFNTTGYSNAASGSSALFSNTTGNNNTASGWAALGSNTTGSNNTASGELAGLDNLTGSYNTFVGAGADAISGNLTNATAIGANAKVGESNALVLGGTGTYAVYVGIGTSTPDHVFTIAQGAGHAIADGWDTYSSRRWKTNIQTLPDALAKVERLRGVSYDLKGNGKHEIGVIAEEVGAVVPEVVTWEKNGKDAEGVDYSRLTALLIEATKQQQANINRLTHANAKQEQQIRQLTQQIHQLQTAQLSLASQLAGLKKVQAQTSKVKKSAPAVPADGSAVAAGGQH